MQVTVRSGPYILITSIGGECCLFEVKIDDDSPNRAGGTMLV